MKILSLILHAQFSGLLYRPLPHHMSIAVNSHDLSSLWIDKHALLRVADHIHEHFYVKHDCHKHQEEGKEYLENPPHWPLGLLKRALLLVVGILSVRCSEELFVLVPKVVVVFLGTVVPALGRLIIISGVWIIVVVLLSPIVIPVEILLCLMMLVTLLNCRSCHIWRNWPRLWCFRGLLSGEGRCRRISFVHRLCPRCHKPRLSL